MIKLKYQDSAIRKVVKEIDANKVKSSLNIRLEILKLYIDEGYLDATDIEKLYISSEKKELKKLNEKDICENMIICYDNTVCPKSAVKIEENNGMSYHIKTAEKGHEHNPHVHIKYQGEEISVYLNSFNIKGSMKKHKVKQKKAVKYVKENNEKFLKEWYKYHEKQNQDEVSGNL